MYQRGEHVPQDAATASRLFARACDADDAEGCYELAVAVEAGSGLAADAVRARELFRKACAGGSDLACRRVAGTSGN
jgi:TPR repeat protein